jgi:hypothetical protein
MEGRGSKKRDTVGHAIHHEIRRTMIKALWHSHEPLTAKRFHREFINNKKIGLNQIVYHVRQLVNVGIVQLDSEPADLAERCFVLAGPNSGEAIRRLRLTSSHPH